MIDTILTWIRHHVPLIPNETERSRWRAEMERQAAASEAAITKLSTDSLTRRSPIERAVLGDQSRRTS